MMLYFVLMLHFCNSATDCRWSRVETFVREDDCQEIGQSYRKEDESVLEYKCVMKMTDIRVQRGE